tara:strand:- start:70 stop:387 length:318 start_codon:yes stop_codon:yes gene_type:complete
VVVGHRDRGAQFKKQSCSFFPRLGQNEKSSQKRSSNALDGARPRTAQSPLRHPLYSDAMTEEEEEDTGPTIFEAAADEEITETHWCVFVASMFLMRFSPFRLLDF